MLNPFKKRKINWDNFLRLLRIIEVAAIASGVIFAAVQIRDVRNMQSAQLMLEFNKDLSNDVNSQIITAIEEGSPVLIKNGGQFSSADLNKYLSSYELLNNTWCAGLINDTMLYNAFGYDVIKTYDNQEIKDYLSEIRKENSLFFAGFENLAKSLILTN